MEKLVMLPHHFVLYAVSRQFKYETSNRLNQLFDQIDQMSDDVNIDFTLEASSGGDAVCRTCRKRETSECVSDIEAEAALLIRIKDALNMKDGEFFTVRNLRYIAKDQHLTSRLDGDFGLIALRLAQRRAR